MRKKILEAIEAVRPFVPRMQLKTLVDNLRWSEERGWFRDKLLELAQVVQTMPVTYGQDGKAWDAVVHLHYFYGGGDWWITEKDVDGGVDQAFGMVDLGHGPELGYISIAELVRLKVMDLDLHWTPKTLAEVKAAKYGAPKPEPVKVAPPAYTVAQVVDVQDWFADVAPGVTH